MFATVNLKKGLQNSKFVINIIAYFRNNKTKMRHFCKNLFFFNADFSRVVLRHFEMDKIILAPTIHFSVFLLSQQKKTEIFCAPLFARNLE